MPRGQPDRILAINSSSSSIKFALCQMGDAEKFVLSGRIERIGLRPCLFHAEDLQGGIRTDRKIDPADHDDALKVLMTESPAGQRNGSKGPLSPEELRKMDSDWRGSPYLCGRMIFLRDNPLLRALLTNFEKHGDRNH